MSIFYFFIKTAMAKAVKILVSNLLAEFFAHALVILGLFHTARAIPSARFKPFLNEFYNRFVVVKFYSHM